MYVAYFQCDRCGKREHTDLTPPGWTFPDGGDVCPACSKVERDLQTEQGKDSK